RAGDGDRRGDGGGLRLADLPRRDRVRAPDRDPVGAPRRHPGPQRGREGLMSPGLRGAAWLAGSVAVLLVLNFALRRHFNTYIIQVVMLCGINVILAVSLNLINGFTGQFSIGHAGFMAIGGYGSAMITLHGGSGWAAAL